MKFIMRLGFGLALLGLTGCFMTKDNQLIPTGVQLAKSDLSFCIEDKCDKAVFSEGRYLIEDSETGTEFSAAFLPLTLANARQIYLVEFKENHEADAIYIAARLKSPQASKLNEIETVTLSCDMSAAEMKALGWRSGSILGSCEVTDLDSLKAVVMQRHAKDFADETWWLENL